MISAQKVNNIIDLNQHFEKVDLLALAKKYGTPLYVYDKNTIIDSYNAILSAIPYRFLHIHYAVMCNNRKEILKTFLNLKSYLQVNSIQEYNFVRKLGFQNDKISITTTNISPSDMEKFIIDKANLNLDSIEEVETYGKILTKLKTKNPNHKYNDKIGVRIFLDLEFDNTNMTNQPYKSKSRVGIKVEKIEYLLGIAKKYDLKIVGVHGYFASNVTDTQLIIKHNKLLINHAKNFPDLEYVNVGGGFGLALKPNEADFDWEAYGKVISDEMNNLCDCFGRFISLKIEPGRALVGDAGILLASVTNIKDMDSWKSVGIDCGFGTFPRPYIYNWNKEGYHPIIVVNKNNDASEELYTICSNSVLQQDYIAEDRLLPKVNIGDVIAILKTGAYCSVMSSNFPGAKEYKEIIIEGKKIKLIDSK